MPATQAPAEMSVPPPQRPQVDARHDEDFKSLMEAMAVAVEAQNTRLLASCWTVPALVVGRDATGAGDHREIESHCAAFVAAIRERGPGSATPRIERVAPLGAATVWAEVIWMPPGTEPQSFLRRIYLATLADDGCLRIAAEIALPLRKATVDGVTAALEDTFPASDPVASQAPATSLGAPPERQTDG